MNAREFLEILHVAERLKDTPRHCTTSKRRTESVAEHSWRISLMAFLLKDEFPDLDIDKVTAMCLIHDLGECFTGDIPSFRKTDKDRDTEDSLLNEWVESLPEEISERMASLYKEMEEQETAESRLYKALDKLEAVIQHNESPLDTWEDHEYELNKTYGFKEVEDSKWFKELRNEILKDTERKIEDEKKEIRSFSTLEEARELFKNDRFAMNAGMQVDETTERSATCSMVLTNDHKNAYGGVMGGAIFTLADLALAVTANRIHYPSVASQISINYLSAPKGAKLIAHAECIKDGRTTTVINIDVSDEKGTHVAHLTGTAFKK